MQNFVLASTSFFITEIRAGSVAGPEVGAEGDEEAGEGEMAEASKAVKYAVDWLGIGGAG
jgi:hypothetical protein